jgi:hypothetical protein
MQERLVYPLIEGFAQISVKKSLGYELVAAGVIKPFKIGARSFVTNWELQRAVRELEANGFQPRDMRAAVEAAKRKARRRSGKEDEPATGTAGDDTEH